MTPLQIIFIAVAAFLITWVGTRMIKNIMASNWNDLAISSFWMLAIGGITMLLQPTLF